MLKNFLVQSTNSVTKLSIIEEFVIYISVKFHGIDPWRVFLDVVISMTNFVM